MAKIYGLVHIKDSKFTYDVAIKKYPNGRVEIKEYANSLMRLKAGMEPLQEETKNSCIISPEEKKVVTAPKSNVSAIRSDSLHRTLTNLIDYIEFNPIWTSFITLTFKDNVTDLDIANYEFRKYTQKVKRVFKDFKYIGVPEFQKRGAVHYHILTNLEIGGDLIPLRESKKTFNKEKQTYYNLEYYDLPYWINGFSSAFDIINETDSNFNLALYMTKYLFKDIDNRLWGRQKILKSQGLKKPEIQRLKKDSQEYKLIKKALKTSGVYKDPTIKGVSSQREFAPDMIIYNYFPKSIRS